MNLREQFEKWYRTQNKVFQDTFNKAEKGERDRYYYDRVESGWQGFQSGHAAGLEQAEGHSANTVGEREACPACGDDVEHVWCLISPEGKRFTGDTKMAAYREEASSRIPATEQLANIMRANAECEAEYQADLEQARKQGYQSGYAAGLEVNSANTVGGPTPVMDAAPACEW